MLTAKLLALALWLRQPGLRLLSRVLAGLKTRRAAKWYIARLAPDAMLRRNGLSDA